MWAEPFVLWAVCQPKSEAVNNIKCTSSLFTALPRKYPALCCRFISSQHAMRKHTQQAHPPRQASEPILQSTSLQQATSREKETVAHVSHQPFHLLCRRDMPADNAAPEQQIEYCVLILTRVKWCSHRHLSHICQTQPVIALGIFRRTAAP